MKNKRKIMIFSLLLLISLGYAVLSSYLRINGSSRIASSTWNIHFNNIVPKQGSVPIGTGDRAATITPNKDTEVTYSITLSKPGDFYEFNVDVVNSGSIDGMVNLLTSTFKEAGEEDIIINSDSSNIPSYLKYSITYSDGAPIEATHLLKSGQTETYTIRIEFKKDIQNNELPQTDQSFDIVVNGDYKQRDDTAKERPPYHPCTYDGELIQGAEYVNGQYTYRYMQEGTYNSWNNMENDGWGVKLTNNNSTAPVNTTLCTTINNKPIVSMDYMFQSSKTTSIDFSSFNTSNVTSMQSMFFEMDNIDTIDLSTLDTSKVTNMQYLFAYNKANNIILTNFNTSNVTNMFDMFYLANNITNLDVSSFNTSKVTNMSSMFYGLDNLKNLDLSSFDTSRVTNMGSMFGSNKLDKLNISNFNFTSLQGSTNSLLDRLGFYNSSLKELNLKNAIFPVDSSSFFGYKFTSDIDIILDNADTSHVKNMGSMFAGLSQIKHIDVSSFDTSNVVNMYDMFYQVGAETIKFGINFDTSNVKDMYAMFQSTPNLRELDLSMFNMANVTRTDYMFDSSGAITGYARTQADADILNSTSGKPSTLTFTVKNH